jgi:hypothetical protein
MALVGAAFSAPPHRGECQSGFPTMTKDLKSVPGFNRIWLGLFAFAGVLACCGTAARAQQFSADLVIMQHDGTAVTSAGRLRVSGDKVRIETPELADGFFLIDGSAPSAYFVRPATRVFMDAKQSSRLIRLFVPVDPTNPCRQWQAMARLAGIAEQGDWHCERMGEETTGVRNTVGYRAVSASGREFLGWIDVTRKFPLRIRTEDGSVVEAENIRDEPQAASSFEIPSGYGRFDPLALVRQIKQSDVWVAGGKDSPPSHP